jgi:hypothetical protein
LRVENPSLLVTFILSENRSSGARNRHRVLFHPIDARC